MTGVHLYLHNYFPVTLFQILFLESTQNARSERNGIKPLQSGKYSPLRNLAYFAWCKDNIICIHPVSISKSYLLINLLNHPLRWSWHCHFERFESFYSILFNPFQARVPFLYPLENIRKPLVFKFFQGV